MNTNKIYPIVPWVPERLFALILIPGLIFYRELQENQFHFVLRLTDFKALQYKNLTDFQRILRNDFGNLALSAIYKVFKLILEDFSMPAMTENLR